MEEAGKTVAIRHIYFDRSEIFSSVYPKVVVTPFFYNASDQGIREYIAQYPAATFFNLAWEEIFYEGHKKLKAPSDEVARSQVFHQAWGEFYRQFLVANGVKNKNIFLNGNPAYQLYSPPYRDFFPSRGELASRYHLDVNKRWLLVPENYNWAFITYSTMLWRVSRGGSLLDMISMRAYARRSLRALLQWCHKLALDESIEIIFRPKPATSLKETLRFFQTEIGNPTKNLHFYKGGSVREWILSSDVVISSFSTTLIEAALAGKPIAMVEPEPLIRAFSADWYQLLPKVTAYSSFREAAISTPMKSSVSLRKWAVETMLAPPDCVQALATQLISLIKQSRVK